MREYGPEDAREAFLRSREGLIRAVTDLGFPEEFGELIANELRLGPWIRRMTSYLRNVCPTRVDQVADEMLALAEDRDRWLEKKENEESNSRYNAWLNSDRRCRED